MDVTKKVKQLLVEYDLTATELAKKIGISQPYLSKKMKNNDWAVSDLEKIADVLGIAYEGFFVLDNGVKI